MKIMIAAVFYFLYWGVCFLGTGTDRKNLIGLRSYPDEVQTRVQSDPQLGQAVPKAKSTAAILNCTPFVRQYGILFRKWGVFVCQRDNESTTELKR